MSESIKFSISSDVPGMVMKNVELVVEPRKLGTSWFGLLVVHKPGLSQMDINTMMVRSSGRSIMTALNEPVRDFLSQYRKKVKIYRVQIVKTRMKSSARESLEARRLGLKIERQESSSSGSAATRLPVAAKRVGVILRSGENSVAAAVGQQKGNLNLPGTIRHLENAPNGVPNAPVGDVEESNVDMNFDDTASQCSQDSQDPGTDLKSGALERFEKFVNDGDIIRINDELENLSRKNKWLKFSREISYTLTVLRMIFRPQLDH